ncbi:MAG: transcriptional regulator [Cyanobacteria bacterium RYN_339]|nr:transcriptional regulator [Cyanobacteria bacterium RYN_339]
MTEAELHVYLATTYPREDAACEWKEFKSLNHAVAGHKAEDVVSYVSAIANVAGGHLIMGVEDKTLRIVGIQDFKDYTPENFCPRVVGRCKHLDSEGLRLETFMASDTGRTVWVLHVPKHLPRRPVYAHGEAWQRLGDELVAMRPERLEAILAEPIEGTDWTALVVPAATMRDVDLAAIALARVKFAEHHANASFAADLPAWSDETFLDRARLTRDGQFTRAALLLLGNEGAVHLLSPHMAQITWKLDTEERAYRHFSPPFLVTTTQVAQQIRNVSQKLFPANQLLATEVMKYDPRVILEALHNALAHQDYERGARIILMEKADRLVFENAGGFFAGRAEDYFTGEKTPDRYRNPWLVQVMASLGMIDTMGYGIFTMTQSQRRRYFPLPDYGKSTASHVVLEIFGQALDPRYSLLLLERGELPIRTVILLDRVQKRLPLADADVRLLRREGLVEGRKPNLFLAAHVADTVGNQEAYTRNKGLEKEQLKQFVLVHLQRFPAATRRKLDDLLGPLLPDGLSPEQKENKVKNLLAEMQVDDGTVTVDGKGPGARWRLVTPSGADGGASHAGK